MSTVQRAQAREPRVGDPCLAAGKRELVDLDVAADQRLARQITRIVPARRGERRHDARVIDVLPHVIPRADDHDAVPFGQSHRRSDIATERVGRIAVRPDHEQFPRLISADEERNPELPQQRRKGDRVRGAHRCGVLRLRCRGFGHGGVASGRG